MFCIFTTEAPIKVEELRLDLHEIQYSKAFSQEDILKMTHENPNDFAPTFIVALQEFLRHYNNLASGR